MKKFYLQFITITYIIGVMLLTCFCFIGFLLTEEWLFQVIGWFGVGYQTITLMLAVALR